MDSMEKDKAPYLATDQLVSIIVLSYMNTEFLHECLDSIYIQTYQDIELIISNDGSHDFDETLVAADVEKNKSPNIKNVIINKNPKNVGTVRHCNIALDLSHGSYIMFIACDDAYNNKDAVKDMIEGFNVAPPDVMSIVGQTGMYDEDLKECQELYVSKDTQGLINKLSPQEFYRKHLVLMSLLPPASRVFRKEVFEKYGKFDEDYYIIEDWTTSVSHAKQGMRTYYLDIMCINHRDGGISHSEPNPHSSAQKMYILDYLKALETGLQDESLDKKVLKRLKQIKKWEAYRYGKTFIAPFLKRPGEKLRFFVDYELRYRFPRKCRTFLRIIKNWIYVLTIGREKKADREKKKGREKK